jgi:hypothetical protein
MHGHGLFFYYFLFFYYLNQQSEYKVFYKVMCWLGVQLVDLLEWWGPLQQGALVDHITGQLATIFLVFIWRYLVEGVEVMDWSVILSLYGLYGWLFVQLEYLGQGLFKKNEIKPFDLVFILHYKKFIV